MLCIRMAMVAIVCTWDCNVHASQSVHPWGKDALRVQSGLPSYRPRMFGCSVWVGLCCVSAFRQASHFGATLVQYCLFIVCWLAASTACALLEQRTALKQFIGMCITPDLIPVACMWVCSVWVGLWYVSASSSFSEPIRHHSWCSVACYHVLAGRQSSSAGEKDASDAVYCCIALSWLWFQSHACGSAAFSVISVWPQGIMLWISSMLNVL